MIGKVFERILASELKVSTSGCQFRSRYIQYVYIYRVYIYILYYTYIRDSGWVFLGMHGILDILVGW